LKGEAELGVEVIFRIQKKNETETPWTSKEVGVGLKGLSGKGEL